MPARPPQRLILLADPGHKTSASVVSVLRERLRGLVDIVRELPPDNCPLPDDLDVDAAIVVGGDGTLIGQARRVIAHDLPLIGVNVGRLGFLAEFDADSLIEHAAAVFGDNPPTHDIMVLDASVVRSGGSDVEQPSGGLAVNDCVITAGSPFSMIRLELQINGKPGPMLTGDGVIVATPVGSTAYNLSAGGPIVHPAHEAMVITPLAAHSLAFRPLVIPGGFELAIDVKRCNEGTALIQDGQVPTRLRQGDRIIVRQHDRRVRFVINPDTSYWAILQDKLRWAVTPNYQER